MKKSGLMSAVLAIGAVALLLFGTSNALAPRVEAKLQAENARIMQALLPGSGSFTGEVYDGEDTAIRRVLKGENGFVIETVTAGYAGEIRLLTGVSNDGTVTGVVIRDMEETYGLGDRARNDVGFLAQFLGTSGQAEIGAGIDAMSGATVTSKAVTKGVNSAAAYVTGADVTSAATTWGG